MREAESEAKEEEREGVEVIPVVADEASILVTEEETK